MLQLVYPYLVGLAATLIVVGISVAAYFRAENRMRLYSQLLQKLPDAVRYEDLRARLGDLEREWDSRREELAEARRLIAERDEAVMQMQDMREQLLSLQAEREQQERVRAELVALQENTAKEREEHFTLVQQMEANRLECERLAEARKALSEDMSRKEEEAKRRKAELLELESRHGKLSTEVAGLEKQLASSREQLEDAKADLARRLSSINREIEEAIHRRDDTIAKHELEMQQAVKEKQALQQDLASAQSDLGGIRQEHARLSAELRGLQAEKVAMEKRLTGLQEDWQRMLIKTGHDDGKGSARTAELWLPVFTRGELLRRAPEEERLDQLQQYLSAQQLYFPERVLWAFHTSLKVSEISPLVVLAGISGTGKSELPRRYADLMGMNFLNMAVQPRWDSPQDMFGFFNYLENRYRATELGRALVQMDPFFDRAQKYRGWHPPKDWSNNSLRDEMLLVLLDEMNLARVEYYFSEFLSRLETRRGVNLQDDSDRRKAEIAFEIGASSQNRDPVMHVFVGANVLFAGTMNEDETTQSLSDKVVDRANVLRFGRPRRLSRESTNGREASASTSGKQRLSHETWRSWQRTDDDLDPGQSDQVNKWVQSLNDAMTRIGRPFAYRTSQSMRRYVANYPTLDPDRLVHAMADQVEQKVLPKFRGLDPTDPPVRDAIREIRSVLAELKDQCLTDAIDSAASGHQFVWLGVDPFAEEEELSL